MAAGGISVAGTFCVRPASPGEIRELSRELGPAHGGAKPGAAVPNSRSLGHAR